MNLRFFLNTNLYVIFVLQMTAFNNSFKVLRKENKYFKPRHV